MNGFAGLVDLITTAVAARLSRTLSKHLNRVARQYYRGSGSSFSHALGQSTHSRRVGATQSAFRAAQQAHAQAMTDYEVASQRVDADVSNPTSRDLDKCRSAAVQTDRALLDAAGRLHNAAVAYERTVLDVVQPASRARLEKSSSVVAAAQSAHADVRQRYQNAVNEYRQEQTNPTGKDLKKLGMAVLRYENALSKAAQNVQQTTSAHDRLRETLSHEAQESAPGSAPRRKWFERFPSWTSKEHRERLNVLLQSRPQVLKEQADVEAQYAVAHKEYVGEVSRPRANYLHAQPSKMSSFKKGLDEASKRPRASADAHAKRRIEVGRLTRCQQERTNNWPNPVQAFAKVKQVARIFGKSVQRTRGAFAHRARAQKALKAATQTYQQAQTAYHTNHASFTSAMMAYKAARTSGDVARIASTRATAAVAANAFGKSSATVQTAKSGVTSARVAEKRATGVATRSAIVTAIAAAGPVGLAFAAATAAVALMSTAAKSFRNRQTYTSGQLVNGQIYKRSQFSSHLARAAGQYDLQQLRPDMRAARQTSATGAGMVQSTMALKEAQQPRDVRGEEIGNRPQSEAAEMAAGIQQVINQLDFITPLISESVKLLECLPWVKKNTDKPGNVVNFGISAFRSAFTANKETKHMKAFPPLPPLK